jgi:hypothetical protein
MKTIITLLLTMALVTPVLADDFCNAGCALAAKKCEKNSNYDTDALIACSEAESKCIEKCDARESRSIITLPALDPKYECIINRSISMRISFSHMGIARPVNVILEKKHFMDEGTDHIAILGNVEVIEYGNVFMIFSNMGKSGYAMIRVEDNGEETLKGQMDINLFSVDGSTDLINTHGKLFETFCYKL